MTDPAVLDFDDDVIGIRLTALEGKRRERRTGGSGSVALGELLNR
jgi:hypothetical protein